MSRKKPIELIEDKKLPRALIIGGDFITSYLSSVLSKGGCQVVSEESYYPSLGRFDYIFQFDHFQMTNTATGRHLNSGGKFLFIETAEKQDLKTVEGIKVVKVGDLSLWSPFELSRLLLRSMFSANEKSVHDVRKHLRFKPKEIAKKYGSAVSIKTLPPSLQPEVVKKSHLVTKRRLTIIGLAFLLLILFFATTVYLYLLSIQRTFANFRQHLATNNWLSLDDDIKEARRKIRIANFFYESANSILIPLRNISYWQDLGGILATSNDLFVTGEDILSFSEELQKRSLEKSSADKSATFDFDFQILERKIISTQKAIVNAREKLDRISLPLFPKENYITFLKSFSEKLSATNEILPAMEKLLFTRGVKVYLLLFQNNMEIRPTGGFIGSFGLATVDKGRLIDLKIEDVYTADGQLKGHVDPPQPIRKYLSQPHYFLRDSNFDPDFASSSIQASFFLQKELGVGVDGVIGINLFTVQKILQILGPLTISDFGGEEINSGNFFFKAHYFSQENFFPGSTQKKDFLTSVANALIAKITAEKDSVLMEVLPAVKELLDEKNITLYTSDESIQKIIEKHGWGGRLSEVRCLTDKVKEGTQFTAVSELKSCIPDYLSIIEANLGVNKANYFISKSVAIEKKIEIDGKISTTITLSYENSSTPEVFTGATYTNYLRVFVPIGSTLTDITLNNMPIPISSVDIENYGMDKMSFGTLVKIAPENKGVVKVTYTLPRVISSDASSYQFLYQKQSGDKVSPLVFTIDKPKEMNLNPANFNNFSVKDNKVSYSTDTSVDRIFAFEISR